MKTLDELNNTERAKLLADLFPHEIPQILESIEQLYTTLKEQEKEFRGRWNDRYFFTAGAWIALADECLTIIRRYKNKKLMNSRIFSDQLFYGHRSLYMIDCIIKFSESNDGRSKFKLAVDLLFKP